MSKINCPFQCWRMKNIMVNLPFAAKSRQNRNNKRNKIIKYPRGFEFLGENDKGNGRAPGGNRHKFAETDNGMAFKS